MRFRKKISKFFSSKFSNIGQFKKKNRKSPAYGFGEKLGDTIDGQWDHFSEFIAWGAWDAFFVLETRARA